MEQETVYKRDEGSVILLDHREKSKKTFFVDSGEIDPGAKSLVKENVDFRWWYTEETEGLLLNRLKALIRDDPMIKVILSSSKEYQSPYIIQTNLFITESRTYHDTPQSLPSKEWYLSAEVNVSTSKTPSSFPVPVYTALVDKLYFGDRKWDKDGCSIGWSELIVDTVFDIIHKGVRDFLQRDHDRYLNPHRYK
jgi:hypothetical protein